MDDMRRTSIRESNSPETTKTRVRFAAVVHPSTTLKKDKGSNRESVSRMAEKHELVLPKANYSKPQ